MSGGGSGAPATRGREPVVSFGPARRAIRVGGVSTVVNLRTVILIVVAVIGSGVAFFLSTALGDFPIPVDEVMAILGGHDAGFSAKVVLEWRLPRAVAGLVFGAALGVSGALFQSVTRNPLGSPDLLGLGAGAFTGALVAVLVVPGPVAVILLSLLGGLLAAALIYLLAYRRGVTGIRLVIVGIAVSSALTAVNSMLLLRMSTVLATTVSIWAQGTLEGVTWEELLPTGTGAIVLVAVACALAPHLRQLELGDSAASTTGVTIERTRLLLLLVGVLLTAVVTSITGPIAFVPLVAPQLARLVAGSGGATLLGAAATGALLLGASDVVAAHLLPTTVPVGVVTAVAGGVYLLWLILREARRS